MALAAARGGAGALQAVARAAHARARLAAALRARDAARGMQARARACLARAAAARLREAAENLQARVRACKALPEGADAGPAAAAAAAAAAGTEAQGAGLLYAHGARGAGGSAYKDTEAEDSDGFADASGASPLSPADVTADAGTDAGSGAGAGARGGAVALPDGRVLGADDVWALLQAAARPAPDAAPRTPAARMAPPAPTGGPGTPAGGGAAAALVGLLGLPAPPPPSLLLLLPMSLLYTHSLSIRALPVGPRRALGAGRRGGRGRAGGRQPGARAGAGNPPPPPPPSYQVDTPRPSPRTNRTRLVRAVQVGAARAQLGALEALLEAAPQRAAHEAALAQRDAAAREAAVLRAENARLQGKLEAVRLQVLPCQLLRKEAPPCAPRSRPLPTLRSAGIALSLPPSNVLTELPLSLSPPIPLSLFPLTLLIALLISQEEALRELAQRHAAAEAQLLASNIRRVRVAPRPPKPAAWAGPTKIAAWAGPSHCRFPPKIAAWAGQPCSMGWS